ncbi:putative peptide deformylase [Helianthus debilis subsp. tardiflorus]
MVKVMRGAPGVGFAAPQIGIPLKVSFIFYLKYLILVVYGFNMNLCWWVDPTHFRLLYWRTH